MVLETDHAEKSREQRRKTGLIREVAITLPMQAVSACLLWRYVR